MAKPLQLEFPFPSLDFPGRTTLMVHEIASRVGVTTRHIIDLVDEGRITAINLSGGANKSDRRCLRIPLESYRDFIIAALSGPARQSFLESLPRQTLIELYAEVSRILTDPRS